MLKHIQLRNPRRTSFHFAKFLCALFAIAILSAAPLAGQDRFGEVRRMIHEKIRDGGVPSVAVAVAQHGKIIWEEGFGWANREERIAATEHTMYSMASISKPITATGLMTLVQAGKIDLDKPLNDYLGDAKLVARIGDVKDATVRRVANHSSGLPLHYQFFFSNIPFHKPSDDETVLRYANLVTIPGEHYQYSNLGFGILGFIVSRVSGETFPEYMREAVFAKLGLTHMSVDIGPGLDKFQAIRYDETGAPIPFYDFDHPGASAMYSSAHDLVRFGMFHLKDHLQDQSQILSDASLDEMHRPSMKTSTKDDDGYGIGWASHTRPDGYKVVEHSGGMPGVRTDLMLVPSEDLAVVVLENCACDSGVIAEQIFKAILPKWQVAPGYHEPALSPFNPGELVGTWKGTMHTYQRDLPVTMEFLSSGDVHFQIADEPNSLVNKPQFQDGWFSGQGWGDVKTGDAERHGIKTYSLSLKLRGDVLNGAMQAQQGGYDPIALTQWMELKKQK
jgi:CubicO group peptidase (beta-lactamase class C family)